MIQQILFLPHGMQIIPNVEDDPSPEFSVLDQQMHNLLDRFSELNPVNEDVILLTPHGYHLKENMVIYQHDNYHGFIYELQDNSPVFGTPKEKLEFKGNPSLTEEVIEQAKKFQLNYEVLTNGYPSYPLMLNWGEVVPMYYYSSYFSSSKYSIMCYPRTRHSDLEAIQLINKDLVKILQNLDRDITLVVSGDLSHVHKEEGPYGFHKSAVEFDNLVNTWASTYKKDLMEKIFDLQPDALACGFSGLDLIHLLLQEYAFDLQYGFYEVPTYFGMGGYWWDLRS